MPVVESVGDMVMKFLENHEVMVCLFVCLPGCLFICLSVHACVCLLVFYLSSERLAIVRRLVNNIVRRRVWKVTV